MGSKRKMLIKLLGDSCHQRGRDTEYLKMRGKSQASTTNQVGIFGISLSDFSLTFFFAFISFLQGHQLLLTVQ